MNAIRHDYERVQLIAFESAFAIGKCPHNHFGDLRLTQENRTADRVIQQSIHGHESFSGCKPHVRKGAVDRKTSVQAEGHEHSLANDIPMRKAPVIPAHVDLSSGRGLIFSGNCVMVCAGRKPGGRAEALHHGLVGDGFEGSGLGEMSAHEYL